MRRIRGGATVLGALVLAQVGYPLTGGRVRAGLVVATVLLGLAVSVGHAARAGVVEEHRSGALADADALFRTADEPWCSTFF